MQLWAQPSVYAKKLLVHNGGQWQGAEGFHACFINVLRVFMLTLEFEGEVIRQVSTLMVASK